DQHVHRRKGGDRHRRHPAGDGQTVMPQLALAAAATLLTFAPHGNRVELNLDRGSAEIVWLTPSTFHFRRVLDGALRAIEETAREPVVLQSEDARDEIRIRSHVLEV